MAEYTVVTLGVVLAFSVVLSCRDLNYADGTTTAFPSLSPLRSASALLSVDLATHE